MRVIDIVRKIAPLARRDYLTAFDHGDGLLLAAEINTPQRVAHFLAQIMHESGALTITQENMNYRAPRIMEIFGVGRHSAAVTPAEADRLAGKPYDLAERVYGIGNPTKSREFENNHAGDGYTYRGGGILQTTGKSNYRNMGMKCQVDFENHPELVFSAEHALKPAVAEWVEGNCNTYADSDQLNVITKIINGGVNGLAERRAWYAKIRPMMPPQFTFDTTVLPPLPAPPDIEPPVAQPKPQNTQRNVTTGSTVLASIIIALQSNSLKYTIAIVAGGIVLAFIIHLIYNKLER